MQSEFTALHVHNKYWYMTLWTRGKKLSNIEFNYIVVVQIEFSIETTKKLHLRVHWDHWPANDHSRFTCSKYKILYKWQIVR
mgnify:CR=1 FL=1